jgi:pyrrolidone-carboxylate peptidase
MFVTGFGPFGSITDNPSSMLAEISGRPFHVLTVSFRAVDEFLEGLDPSFDSLLLIGVAAGADSFRVETVARNEIGPAPDVEGEQWGPGPIDPRLPRQLAATLWPVELLAEDPRWAPSVDAGNYLCNYVFFRALARFPDKPVGFLHVPSYETLSAEEQRRRFAEFLGVLGGGLRTRPSSPAVQHLGSCCTGSA